MEPPLRKFFYTMTENRGQFAASVEANIPLCAEHWRLVLRLDHFPKTEPGQFVQLSCQSEPSTTGEFDWKAGQRPHLHGNELQSPQAILRRPFSLAGRRDLPGHVELDIIHRAVGLGTHWLSKLAPNDKVDVLGPLGNRFTLAPPGGMALLVGGGVGIPPMIYLAEKLAGRPAVAFAGAVSRTLLPLTITDEAPVDGAEPAMNVQEFARHGIPTIISTDDGSLGVHGYVTTALETYLNENPDPHSVIYTCGPELMMKRVAQIALDRNIECQVAVERAMACGMGTCQSCCIRVKKPDPSKPPLAGSDWCYRLACTDGPIFRAAELLW
jgi:dihydroorotate dehydrogenase electron transfer subunit